MVDLRISIRDRQDGLISLLRFRVPLRSGQSRVVCNPFQGREKIETLLFPDNGNRIFVGSASVAMNVVIIDFQRRGFLVVPETGDASISVHVKSQKTASFWWRYAVNFDVDTSLIIL